MLSANFTTGLPEYNQGPERGVSMKKVRKLFSVLLSILLIAGMMPMAISAAPTAVTEPDSPRYLILMIRFWCLPWVMTGTGRL